MEKQRLTKQQKVKHVSKKKKLKVILLSYLYIIIGIILLFIGMKASAWYINSFRSCPVLAEKYGYFSDNYHEWIAFKQCVLPGHTVKEVAYYGVKDIEDGICS